MRFKPNEGLTYTIVLFDTNRKIKRVWTRASRSFLIQYLQHLRCAMNNDTESDVKNITNTAKNLRTYSTGGPFLTSTGNINDDTRGIVVGSNATAALITDFALNTLIAHGAGAGQLRYGTQDRVEVFGSGGSRKYAIFRAFENSSGAIVTIREIGIYADSQDTVPSTQTFCIVRDIPTEVALLDGEAVAISYRHQITV